MGWWIFFGVLFLLAILPLGVSAGYDSGGPLVRLIAGPIRFTIFPMKKKEKTKSKEAETAKEKKEVSQNSSAKKPEPKKQPEPKTKTAQSGGSWQDFLPLVQVALDFLGDFRRKLRVDVLELKLILAGDDPCDLATNYGRAWAALGNLWPRLEQLFVIKKRDVQVECDFTSDTTLITARLDLTITLGRLISLVVRYGIRAFKEFMKIKNQRKGGATT